MVYLKSSRCSSVTSSCTTSFIPKIQLLAKYSLTFITPVASFVCVCVGVGVGVGVCVCVGSCLNRCYVLTSP